MQRLNRLLLKKESYSPEDLPTALRIGSTLWAMGMAIAILLLPLSPPDEAIGAAGWIVTAVLVAAGIGAWFAYRSPSLPWTFARLYAASFLTIIAIGLMQWLAGGVGSPYFSLCCSASSTSPRSTRHARSPASWWSWPPRSPPPSSMAAGAPTPPPRPSPTS